MEIYHPRDDELIREMRRVRRSARRKRLIWGLVISLVLSIAAGLFVFHRYYRLAVVHGTSMADTLPEGSVVLVRRAEEDNRYSAGDIILFEKRFSAPIEMTILSPKGKTREYCQYRLYRDVGTTRQYMTRKNGSVEWVPSINDGDMLEVDPEGTLVLDTEGLPNGEYWLKETRASYGQDVLQDPFPVTVTNPTITQMKRILAAPGDRVVLSPYAETRMNGLEIDRSRTSGRTADTVTEVRRVNVENGQYFVQGDQLSLSVDSRDKDFGTVRQNETLGRAEFVLWPIRAFGSLEGQAVTAGSGQEGAE